MRYHRTILGKKNKDLIIIFPHWNAKDLHCYNVLWDLSRKHCVLLYYYDPDIVMYDVKETRDNFDIIIDDACEYIKENHFTSVNALGYSLGTFLSFMLAKKTDVKKIFLVSSAADFAEVIWSGTSAKETKRQLIMKGETLATVQKGWKTMAPITDIDKVKSKISIVLSETDQVVLYTLAKELLNKLKNYELKVHRLSHTALIVRYLFLTKRIVNFFKEK